MTSKRRKQEDSKTNAASYPRGAVSISTERTRNPGGLKFTIVREADVRSLSRRSVVAGQITKMANGIILCLDWSGDAIVLEMAKVMGACGRVRLAIGNVTSKSAGAR